jgi:hypothetical protein
MESEITKSAKSVAELEQEVLKAHKKSVTTKHKLDQASDAAAKLKTESATADTEWDIAVKALKEAHLAELKGGE